MGNIVRVIFWRKADPGRPEEKSLLQLPSALVIKVDFIHLPRTKPWCNASRTSLRTVRCQPHFILRFYGYLFKSKSDLKVIKAIRNKVDISHALFYAFFFFFILAMQCHWCFWSTSFVCGICQVWLYERQVFLWKEEILVIT